MGSIREIVQELGGWEEKDWGFNKKGSDGRGNNIMNNWDL